ncbi:MAG: ABC transporter permease [Thermodesulfobacteriota bacterium]
MHQNISPRRGFTGADAVVLAVLAVFIYSGTRLAVSSPPVVDGPAISSDPSELPWYALLSVGRMFAAYVLSLIFTFTYGTLAASSRRARPVLLPVLDILQSVPLLSFLPVVILSLTAVMPSQVAVELSAIILIFTSQAWNMTYCWYQSLTTIPKEITEAARIFRMNPWLRFRVVQLPFAAISLLWNSMMSWAGGWFFLMASEMFTVGQKDFRLPGLGAFLQEAASKGDMQAIAWGVGTLVAVIVILDIFVWRPLLAWSERFKLEMLESEHPRTSWVLDSARSSRLIGWFSEHVAGALLERLDSFMSRLLPASGRAVRAGQGSVLLWLLAVPLILVFLYGGFKASLLLARVPPGQWYDIFVGLLATLVRVWTSLALALALTLPLGLSIGLNPRVARLGLPLVQVLASIPSTALFPVVLLALMSLPGGLAVASIFLMFMGSVWYMLFNVMAGASAIPRELISMSDTIGIKGFERLKTLYLPALFPFLVTGGINATGGAWNASIVAEYALVGGGHVATTGLGAVIAQATAAGDYPLLLAATLVMVLTVVGFNRFFWRRLYNLASERYVME